MSAKSKIRQIRVSPEEDRRLVELARSKGITVSDLLRDGALRRRVPTRRLDAVGSEEGGKVSLETVDAAEGEQAGLRPLERTGSSLSAAPGSPAPVAPAADGVSVAAGGANSVAAFRCPHNRSAAGRRTNARCNFTALSPAVRCPVHGEKVVPR